MRIISIGILLFLFQHAFRQSKTENFGMVLHDDWRMQSSLTDHAKGDKISAEDFSAAGWYPITVPSTIIAGLLANHEYKFDPFYATNFEKLVDERLNHTWWFRKIFSLPSSEKNKTASFSCMV
jgi:exo-1,4-beta-D-glucosaminidase